MIGTLEIEKQASNGSTLKGARRCRRKFLRHFPLGFCDETYLAWERDYKWRAHEQWEEHLAEGTLSELIAESEFVEIADRAVRIEARTNLLFSFEKMALRDAVRSPAGARAFACGLRGFLHGCQDRQARFESWCAVVDALPRRQTRVLTWPLVTVWGFIAQPKAHIFVKPTVTKRAAERYAFSLKYNSRPNWVTYRNLLDCAARVQRDLADMKPRDMIDIQSFLWVQGSSEYD